MDRLLSERFSETSTCSHIEERLTLSMIASTLIGERKCESPMGTNQNSLGHVNNMPS